MNEWLEKENEKNREHEKRMMYMLMQMFQTMIAIFRNQEQGPMTLQCQIPFASQRQPQVYDNPCMFNHSQPRSGESNYSRNNSSWVSYIIWMMEYQDKLLWIFPMNKIL